MRPSRCRVMPTAFGCGLIAFGFSMRLTTNVARLPFSDSPGGRPAKDTPRSIRKSQSFL